MLFIGLKYWCSFLQLDFKYSLIWLLWGEAGRTNVTWASLLIIQRAFYCVIKHKVLQKAWRHILTPPSPAWLSPCHLCAFLSLRLWAGRCPARALPIKSTHIPLPIWAGKNLWFCGSDPHAIRIELYLDHLCLLSERLPPPPALGSPC